VISDCQTFTEGSKVANFGNYWKLLEGTGHVIGRKESGDQTLEITGSYWKYNRTLKEKDK
jgi:hypothetical protein